MTNFNPNTASLDELRDWLAGEDGWKYCNFTDSWWRWSFVSRRKPWKRVVLHHPHPPTLDGAAAALPEGCVWWVDCRLVKTTDGSVWAWEWKVRIQLDDGIKYVGCWRTDDEITDRYRLACLARVAQENSK